MVQGALAADAQYERYALYLNDQYESASGWVFEPGIRFSSVRAELDRYYLKNSDPSTVQTPETKTYDEWTVSIRTSKEIAEEQFLFAGLSQGFRPPSLYDLTSTDETSINEAPNVDLSSEKFTQAEVGVRGSSEQWAWQASFYHTWIEDMIVRSPYQATTGKNLALKANGNGYIRGIELELGYDWDSEWKSNLSLSWMESEVEQLEEDAFGSQMKLVDHDNDESTAKILKRFEPVDRATTRLMPTQMQFLTRYEPKHHLGGPSFPSLPSAEPTIFPSKTKPIRPAYPPTERLVSPFLDSGEDERSEKTPNSPYRRKTWATSTTGFMDRG